MEIILIILVLFSGANNYQRATDYVDHVQEKLEKLEKNKEESN